MPFTGSAVALLLLTAPSGADMPAGAFDQVWRPYVAQLDRQCPTRHLALLSPAELRDALDAYRRHIPAKMRLAMERAEQRRCDHVDAGASCSNISDIDVAERRHALPALASSTCRQFATCRAQSDCEPASAHDLQRSIASKGAAAVAVSLSQSGWDTALDEAAAGRTDWIDAIASLRAATDASRSEAIDRALSDALLTNPSEVLRLMAGRADIPKEAWLCQDRTVEPAAAEAREHVRAALATVGNVADPRLKEGRDRCLASFKRTGGSPR